MGRLTELAERAAREGSTDELREVENELRVLSYDRPHDPDLRAAQQVIYHALGWRSNAGPRGHE